MRKAFKFIPLEDVYTPVFDHISKFVPEQTISLREMLLQFSYMSEEKVSEVINRGFFGDEDDDDIIGVDASALDFSELHDRMIDLINRDSLKRYPVDKTAPEPEPEPVHGDGSPEPIKEPEPDAEP